MDAQPAGARPVSEGELVPLEAVQTELAAIEHDIRFDRHAYNRDTEKQQRYRSLLDRKRAVAMASGPTLLQPPVPIFNRTEYAAEGGVPGGYDEYLKLSRIASDVALAVPEEERPAFTASFEALPDEITSAALLELSSRKPSVALSSDTDVANFAKLPEGAVLVREWGHDVHRHHAAVRQRLWRVVARLGDAHAARFLDWHAALPSGTKVAIYRKLAA